MRSLTPLLLAVVLLGCVRTGFQKTSGATRAVDASLVADEGRSQDRRLGDQPAPSLDGKPKPDHQLDAKPDPGKCLAWTAWTCTQGSPADAGTYYCRATCGGFDLICDPKTADCYCNGNWCGKNVAIGDPCAYCKSSWNNGACCGY